MPSVRRICQYCGKEFFTFPSMVKNGKGKYCSNHCSTTANNKTRCQAPEWRAKVSAGVKESWKNPTIKQKRRDAIVLALDNPETKALKSNNTHERMCLPHERKAQSERSKRMWSDENFRDQMRGENAYWWRGGKSFEPYCEKFTDELKEYVRLKFNRVCIICGAHENGARLSVHHIDYNKLQGCKGLTWALVPLCHSCHAKTNFHKWYWFNLLINYWAKNSEINLHDDYCFS